MENPTVFISYSHDSSEHSSWVLKLATDLRSHGVNSILDQWDLRLGNDLRFFMENGLSSSALVLCVCSEKYVQKVDTGIGGSGYEGMIMTQSLLQHANTNYIIPIVRNNNSPRKVPLAFGSKLYTDFSDDMRYISKYQELLERIYGEDTKKKPRLGRNPFSEELSKEIRIKTALESVQYSSPEMEGMVTFQFDNNDGRYTIGSGEYAFETHWSRAGNDSIHAYGMIGFLPDVTAFPEVQEISNYNFSSKSRSISTGQIVVVENTNHHFAAIKLGEVKSSKHGYPLDEMVFDYHIYRSF